MNWEFCNQSIRKARKQHNCDQCKCKIEIGEKYSYVAGKFDGYFEVNKEHISCQKAWQELRDMRALDGYDEAPFLIEDHFEPEEIDWLIVQHPEVYIRCHKHFARFYKPKIVASIIPPAPAV